MDGARFQRPAAAAHYQFDESITRTSVGRAMQNREIERTAIAECWLLPHDVGRAYGRGDAAARMR